MQPGGGLAVRPRCDTCPGRSAPPSRRRGGPAHPGEGSGTIVATVADDEGDLGVGVGRQARCAGGIDDPTHPGSGARGHLLTPSGAPGVGAGRPPCSTCSRGAGPWASSPLRGRRPVTFVDQDIAPASDRGEPGGLRTSTGAVEVVGAPAERFLAGVGRSGAVGPGPARPSARLRPLARLSRPAGGHRGARGSQGRRAPLRVGGRRGQAYGRTHVVIARAHRR